MPFRDHNMHHYEESSNIPMPEERAALQTNKGA